MMGFWDKIECEAEINVELSGGRTAKGRCDGVMLPVERTTETDKEHHTIQLWVCSKCGREVK